MNKLRLIALGLMALGGLMILSNLPAWLFIDLNELAEPGVKFVHPSFFVMVGGVLILSSLFLWQKKKIGFYFSLFSIWATMALFMYMSVTFIGPSNDAIQTSMNIVAFLIVLVPLIVSIMVTRYLLKEEVREQFI